MKNLVFLMMMTAVAGLAEPSERMRVAVMDFNAPDVKASLGLSVAELMRPEMINMNRFVILERSQMEKILNKQGFQQSACSETKCAVKLGKLLSAQKILVGTVSAFGSTFTVNCRLVDVEEGVAEHAASVQVASEDQIPSKVAEFASQLAGRITEETVPEEMNPSVVPGEDWKTWADVELHRRLEKKKAERSGISGKDTMKGVRIVFLTAAGLAGGTALFGLLDSNAKYDAAKAKYSEYEKETDSSVLESLHKEIESLLKAGDTSRTIAFAGAWTMAGCAAVWGIFQAVQSGKAGRIRRLDREIGELEGRVGLMPVPGGWSLAWSRSW